MLLIYLVFIFDFELLLSQFLFRGQCHYLKVIQRAVLLHSDNVLPQIISPKEENERNKYFHYFGQNEQKFMHEFAYTKGNTAIGQFTSYLHQICFFLLVLFLFVGLLKILYSILHQRKRRTITVLEYIKSWYIDLHRFVLFLFCLFNIRFIDVYSLYYNGFSQYVMLLRMYRFNIGSHSVMSDPKISFFNAIFYLSLRDYQDRGNYISPNGYLQLLFSFPSD